MPTDTGKTGVDQNKGFARVHWRGALTDQSDVVPYQLWGYAGSGHKYEKYYTGTPCISTDGRYIVLSTRQMKSGTINDQGRYIFIYDASEVFAAADPLTVDPLGLFGVPTMPNSNGDYVQSVCCDR